MKLLHLIILKLIILGVVACSVVGLPKAQSVGHADYSADWDCSEESEYTGEDECSKPIK